MTVVELINKLQKFNPKEEVIIEDSDFNFRYKINDVEWSNSGCCIIVDESEEIY